MKYTKHISNKRKKMKTADFLNKYGLTENEAPYLRPAKGQLYQEIARAIWCVAAILAFSVVCIVLQ